MTTSRGFIASLAVAAMFTLSAGAAAAEGSMHIAFGDIATIETLPFQIAVERAKERGVDVEVSYVKSEDIASQAVVGGQADIGIGTPYALLQKVKAPIRMFYQMASLRFFPIVNTEFYDGWKDLDGQEIAVHSRGSGTEAIMMLMAKRNGIEYGNISYIPGSEVRAAALLQGNVKATIVDASNRDVVMEKAPGKFMVLPMEGVDATDEALYANTEYLQANPDTVDILVEELLRTTREINANPAIVADLRQQYGLLPELPEEEEAAMVPYFEESVASGAFPPNGGSAKAVKDDFEFYAIAGQLEGDPAELEVADFWDFTALDRALEKLGTE